MNNRQSPRSAAPTYAWSCHVCAASNPAGQGSCLACGHPANISMADVAAARAGVRAAPDAEALVPAVPAEPLESPPSPSDSPRPPTSPPRQPNKRGRFWFYAAGLIVGAMLISAVLLWGANGPLFVMGGAPTATRGHWDLPDWTALGALAVLVLGVPCAALLAFTGVVYRSHPKAALWITAFLLGILVLKVFGWHLVALVGKKFADRSESSVPPIDHQTAPDVAAELDALVTWTVPEPLRPYNRMQAAEGSWFTSSLLAMQPRSYGEAPFLCIQQKDHLPEEAPAAKRAFAKFLAYFDETNHDDISAEEEKERLRLINAAIKARSWRAELSYWLWVANTGMRGDLERSRQVTGELLRMAEDRSNPVIVAAAAARIEDREEGSPTQNGLLRSGLEQGSAQVMTELGGRLAVNGLEYRARGLAMLRCAAGQGDVEAYHPLGLTARLEGRWVDAYRIFELGANQGCRPCAEELASLALLKADFSGNRDDPRGADPEINRLASFYARQFFWQITGLIELKQPAPPSIQLQLSDAQIMGLIGQEMKRSGLKLAPG